MGIFLEGQAKFGRRGKISGGLNDGALVYSIIQSGPEGLDPRAKATDLEIRGIKTSKDERRDELCHQCKLTKTVHGAGKKELTSLIVVQVRYGSNVCFADIDTRAN